MSTLTTEAGYRPVYHVAHAADYWPRGRGRELWIQKAHVDGGCAWEFGVVEVDNIGVRIGVFDDAWSAFTEIPEFFAELARLGKGGSLTDICRILDDLGFTDATERANPSRYR